MYEDHTKKDLIQQLDLAHRRIHELEARQAECIYNSQQFKQLVDRLPIGISVCYDPSCKEIRHNPAMSKFLRIGDWDIASHSDSIPPPFNMFLNGQKMEPEQMPIQRSLWLGDDVPEQEIDFVWEDGIKKTGICKASPLFDLDGRIIGAVTICEDITERKKTETNLRESEQNLSAKLQELNTLVQAGDLNTLLRKILAASIHDREVMEEVLRQSEERFNKVFHSSPAMMAINHMETGRYIDVNESWLRVLEYTRDEVIGRSSSDIDIHPNPDQRAKVEQQLQATGRFHSLEILARSKTGKILNCVFSAEVIELTGEKCILSNFIDITESKRMEKELARLDRLNLIGEMAASIGHEIRNPMTTIRGFMQLLKGWNDDPEWQDYSKLIIEELDRANSIISEFLSLAKNKPVKLRESDLNTIIAAVLPLIRSDSLAKDMNVVFEYNDLPLILIDEQEIRQLLLNLSRNGLEAMPPGGTLTIKTYEENDRVVLSIEDQGYGISDEILSKLGTPFVTTKEDGTGLGLAVCYSIAERHNAWIDVSSSEKGTNFKVYFASALYTKLF